MSGTAVRAQLIQYLADSLRDIPGERRSFFYLPRVLVATQWSRWMADIPALDHGDGQQFRVTYSILPGNEWDALSVSDRLASCGACGGGTAPSPQPTTPTVAR